ncbi:hypothetical protein HK405_008099, partial [Cladochytrium tenue]
RWPPAPARSSRTPATPPRSWPRRSASSLGLQSPASSMPVARPPPLPAAPLSRSLEGERRSRACSRRRRPCRSSPPRSCSRRPQSRSPATRSPTRSASASSARASPPPSRAASSLELSACWRPAWLPTCRTQTRASASSPTRTSSSRPTPWATSRTWRRSCRAPCRPWPRLPAPSPPPQRPPPRSPASAAARTTTTMVMMMATTRTAAGMMTTTTTTTPAPSAMTPRSWPLIGSPASLPPV